MKKKTSLFRMLTTAFCAAAAAATSALADGTEVLGPPSVAIESGSGFALAGTGLEVQPGTINLNVPGTVKQALLYWAGEGDIVGDDTVTVDNGGGAVSVTGTLIGGPTHFFTASPFGPVYFSTYRADITSMIVSGANTLDISDMDFGFNNNGAGLLVIYDDGSTAALELRDGQDLAFAFFVPPLDTTVPQTFNYAADAADRAASLDMFFSSVGPDRPNLIRVTIDDGTVIELIDELASVDGPHWDTLNLPLTIPAGSTSLSVQAISLDDATDRLPASFSWTAAGLAIFGGPCDDVDCDDGDACTIDRCDPATGACINEPIVCDDGDPCTDGVCVDGVCEFTDNGTCPDDFAGCTPGFWRQSHHLQYWCAAYSPNDKTFEVFGVASTTANNKTLLKAVASGGGGEVAFLRHAVAALLNSCNDEVNYEFSTAEVIAMVQDAYDTGDFEGVKDILENANERGCTVDKSADTAARGGKGGR